MGTDIHIHMEYRSRKTRRYQYGGKLRGERLYTIFGVMSDGLFSGEESLFPARGLPDGVTQTTYKDYKDWGCDGHHASWLNTVEFAACIVEAYHRMNSFEAKQYYKKYKDLYLLLEVFMDKHTPRYHEEDRLWSYKKILDIMLDYEKYDGECRIVYWFDN
jgi:hypothetical protein